MGGPNYPMNMYNQNYQKFPAEELKNLRVQLENTIEQLEWLIAMMEAELEEYPTPPEKCQCEDGCCQ